MALGAGDGEGDEQGCELVIFWISRELLYNIVAGKQTYSL